MRDACLKTKLLICMLLLTACASLRMSSPDVALSDIRLLPSEGLEPRFEVTLRFLNPNDREIAVKGGSFRIYLQGSRVVTGVMGSSTIPAFDQALVTATGSGDLIGSVALFHKLLSTNPKQIEYRVELQLQQQQSIVPLIIERSGHVDLSGQR